MKLNNRALMMSGGIGVAVRVLFALLVGALGFAPALEVDASMLGVLGIVGTILCICGWIVAIGIGFAYAFFAAKDGPLTLGDAAIGGAIATGVSGLIGGLVS